ncbi:FkbM family methyltransferase [Gloeobacter kilaueensis]|uniref:Methyltransferase FkbM domain-containing protein n=1 Tax=Gloeobacter kilaueensis (strain ATCC BAA-2537 / CCAP 1431/1 / ULC 316 / JS1) TaxID=1183438 RepID=U5QNI1_GLOK1|nr:FkbM family methyltransferase [Gloeobacter kilaueensis]AGY60423.1 hypothetical protein GKIL_4177 [Gloeobacter kilaueensis JS1]
MFLRPARLKTIKNELFDKLDELLAHIRKLDLLLENMAAITTAGASTLENDSSIIEALIFLAQRVQEGQKVDYEYLLRMARQLERLQEESLGTRTDLKEIQQILRALPQLLQRSTPAPNERLDVSAQPLRQIGVPPLEYSAYDSTEVELMAYLYTFLPSRIALDVGANVGDISKRLLEVGYQVFAFEPYQPAFEQLKQRIGDNENFHPFQLALGPSDTTMQLHIARDLSATGVYKDVTLYSSLLRHPMPADLHFVEAVDVPVRSLASLHRSAEVPATVGLLKIDAEGFDIEVIRGMDTHRYPVVTTEYWDEQMVFAPTNDANRLDRQVAEMRRRGYYWHIVIHRDEGRNDVGFYCNSPRSIASSWGNIFFFQSHDIFSQAFQWCSASLPQTLIASEPTAS